MFYPYTYICLFLTCYFQLCNSYEPITTTVAAIAALGLSLGFAGYKYINCLKNECCDDNWVMLNSVGLEDDLKKYVFGQHFANHIIPRLIRVHMEKEDPKKALVMSFHGCIGSGKNYVSQMIVKNLYKKGSKSDFYHLYIGSKNFPHKQDVNKYRDALCKDIEESTKKCGRSVFVFDEVDKMAPGVFDALKPYLDYHDEVDGVNYRKNIFIFLSNAGASNITRVALKFWADGRTREDIPLKDVEPLISKGAYNEVGGLRHSEIVKQGLIDVYVPFLPLEKYHVKLCAASEMRSRGMRVSQSTVDIIANELVYAPPETELYSVFGCRKIPRTVDLYGDN